MTKEEYTDICEWLVLLTQLEHTQV